jgi:hypothetical protein
LIAEMPPAVSEAVKAAGTRTGNHVMKNFDQSIEIICVQRLI